MAGYPERSDPWRAQWSALARDVGLDPRKIMRVQNCLDRDAIEFTWIGGNGKSYSHTIHIAEDRPGGLREDVLNEFKVKVLMSLAT